MHGHHCEHGAHEDGPVTVCADWQFESKPLDASNRQCTDTTASCEQPRAAFSDAPTGAVAVSDEFVAVDGVKLFRAGMRDFDSVLDYEVYVGDVTNKPSSSTTTPSLPVDRKWWGCASRLPDAFPSRSVHTLSPTTWSEEDVLATYVGRSLETCKMSCADFSEACAGFFEDGVCSLQRSLGTMGEYVLSVVTQQTTSSRHFVSWKMSEFQATVEEESRPIMPPRAPCLGTGHVPSPPVGMSIRTEHGKEPWVVKDVRINGAPVTFKTPPNAPWAAEDGVGWSFGYDAEKTAIDFPGQPLFKVGDAVEVKGESVKHPQDATVLLPAVARPAGGGIVTQAEQGRARLRSGVRQPRAAHQDRARALRRPYRTSTAFGRS